MLSFRALTAISALVLVTTPAYSLSVDATAQSGDTNVEVLEAIVVTARPREESIRDVPGTISAVTADEEVQVLKFLQAGFPLSARFNKPRTYGLSVTYSW